MRLLTVPDNEQIVLRRSFRWFDAARAAAWSCIYPAEFVRAS
jgi:hypothetical protein